MHLTLMPSWKQSFSNFELSVRDISDLFVFFSSTHMGPRSYWVSLPTQYILCAKISLYVFIEHFLWKWGQLFLVYIYTCNFESTPDTNTILHECDANMYHKMFVKFEGHWIKIDIDTGFLI